MIQQLRLSKHMSTFLCCVCDGAVLTEKWKLLQRLGTRPHAEHCPAISISLSLFQNTAAVLTVQSPSIFCEVCLEASCRTLAVFRREGKGMLVIFWTSTCRTIYCCCPHSRNHFRILTPLWAKVCKILSTTIMHQR